MKKTKYLPDNPEQMVLTKFLTDWIADGVLPYELIGPTAGIYLEDIRCMYIVIVHCTV